jgi:DNA-binding HxlR family transcriptional regulator
MKQNNFKKDENKTCPIEHALAIVNGKWKIRILYALVKESPKRFKVLEREVTGITPTMLTSQLRELEKDGLVSRKIFATVPPTVEYSITDLGDTIKPMINEIKKWGISHQLRYCT